MSFLEDLLRRFTGGSHHGRGYSDDRHREERGGFSAIASGDTVKIVIPNMTGDMATIVNRNMIESGDARMNTDGDITSRQS